MRAKSSGSWLGALALVVSVGLLTSAGAQAPATSLGSVRLPQAVMANGQPLAAGSYTLRLSAEAVTPVVGQSPDSAQWVEFVQAGQVRGRELATKMTGADAQAIAKTTPPASGTAKVQLLKGADYVRVWINRAGTHYLVHLSTTPH